MSAPSHVVDQRCSLQTSDIGVFPREFKLRSYAADGDETVLFVSKFSSGVFLDKVYPE